MSNSMKDKDVLKLLLKNGWIEVNVKAVITKSRKTEKR